MEPDIKMTYEKNRNQDSDINPFNKNLIKNHSGQNGLKCDWVVMINDGDGWVVESPPVGVPGLPKDPIFNNIDHCFATSFFCCWKGQIIDLIQEGFTEYELDHVQPIVKVSEWYSCRWDCPAVYANEVILIRESDEIIESHKFFNDLRNEDQNKWFKFEYEFKNYGKGLRKILFGHGGQNRKFWAGHYGSKMAGACITLKLRGIKNNSIKE